MSRKVLHSSKTSEWYTPNVYIDGVREVLGHIDVDPASNDIANLTVKADLYYTKESDGYNRDWHTAQFTPARLFLNPPYQRETARWTEKLIQQYEFGFVSEAILLVNATPDRQWFWSLWVYPICFVKKRIHFVSPNPGEKSRPTHPSCFVYFGENQDKFRKVFSKFGPIVKATGNLLSDF